MLQYFQPITSNISTADIDHLLAAYPSKSAKHIQCAGLPFSMCQTQRPIQRNWTKIRYRQKKELQSPVPLLQLATEV
ncbi:hypothetical protein POX_d05698 [Penicillium oxalicum]|uniref:hypothetical protein n=1 Tax=Penicillium oxalicum TaxID=69781 RepID=UPI0020B80B49|nr:hypothetical protein POX_d05698 [Penicillium oxalicum]KAI2790192.1 hypothetical protein POX_d05698 [Penicillium oxalicum]